MTFAVECIDHVEVFVRDLEAAVEWYADVLGLRETHRWSPEPIMIGAGRNKLALFRLEPGVEPLADEARVGWRRVAWRTTENGLAKAMQQLQRFGISFEGPVDHGVAESIYFADLDGNPLEITCDRAS